MGKEVIKVGVGVMIFKGNKVLLGKRKGSHGAGEYSFPGGILEYGESLKDCVLRETKEECGLEIGEIDFLLTSNIKQYPPKHHVLVAFKALWVSGEPEVLEPEKCEGWDWYDLDDLPSPIFIPSKITIDAYKNKINFIDA